MDREYPLVPFLEKGNHHPNLPLQRLCPQCPCDVAETSQRGQPNNIQSLAELTTDRVHDSTSWIELALLLRSCLTTSATPAPAMFNPKSSVSASFMGCALVKLRRSSKYSFHRLTTLSVEVSSSPSPMQTVQTKGCFPLLSCRTFQILSSSTESLVP